MPTRDEMVAAFQWAADALRSGAIPDNDLFLVLAGHFTQTAQTTATRLMVANRQPVTGLLPNAAMAIAIGTTTRNLNQHKDPIKQFLKAKGLRSHPNADDRKIPTGKPGRRADGFTSQEIQAVAYQVNTIGTLMEAFPLDRRHKAGRKRHT
ncbi:hypothetical protein [Acidithiobacillus sp.]